MIAIREATLDDVPVIVSMWQQLMNEQERMNAYFNLDDSALKRFRTELPSLIKSAYTKLLVANYESELVGFCHAETWYPPPIVRQEMEIFIYEIFVYESFRRHGIGKGFLDNLKKWANSLGVSRLQLGLLAGNNAGYSFWKEHGTVQSYGFLIEVPNH